MTITLYTREQVLNMPGYNFGLESHPDVPEQSIIMSQADKPLNLRQFMCIYLLKKNEEELKEMYIDKEGYELIKVYVSTQKTRFVKEFDAYVFFTIKEYMYELAEAKENKMF